MRMDQERYGTPMPALPTAFTADGKVNGTVMRELVRDLLMQGVEGFYVNGSTGESMMMSIREREAAFEAVAAEARGECTLICHVGTIATRDAVELAKHAKANGADAVSAVPPFYFGFTFAEIKRHYEKIAEVGLPVLLYNIPGASGVSLTTEQYIELLADERMLGIKFTHNNFFMLERIRAAVPDAVLLNGFDEMFLAGQSMGAVGGIGSTYNVMPAKFIEMQRRFQAGDMAGALVFQHSANRVIETMVRFGVIKSLKAVLRAQGYDYGECRAPFTPLTEAQSETLLAVCREEGLL